jgi:DNA polymerase III delta subunit
MKINFSALFRAPIHKYRFFFIFGNDTTVCERSISFLQKKFSSSLNIKKETDLLTQSVSQPSLLEDPRPPALTLVPNVTDKLLKQVDALKDGIFIFTSEKARAHSKLVTYFTGSPHALAIAAYASPVTTAEFESMTGGMNLHVSFQAKLLKSYENDYMGLLSTLEKIKLFGEVPEAYYEAFLENQATEGLAPLLAPFLLRDGKSAILSLSTLSSSDLVSFLRSLIRSFLTLVELMPHKNSLKSVAWQKLTPPVFFKDQPLFESACLRWKGGEVHSFLETLLSLERHVKYSAFSLPQVSQVLLEKL